MPQSVVRKRIAENVIGGNPIADKWLHRFQRSGFPPTGKGMSMRRLGGP